jgi:hypothetical protein
MAHDAGHSGVRAVPPGDPRREAFLRMLAERELRWVVTEPDPTPVDELPVSPGDRPPPVPAVRAIDHFRDAAGALIAAGAVDEQTAVAVLAGLLSALEQRAKLPPAHPFRSMLAPRPWRPRPVAAPPSGPVRVVPAGRPVPFPGDGDQDRQLHLLTVTLAPELAVLSYAGRVPDPDQLRDPCHLRPPGRLPPGPIGPLGPTSVSGHLTFSDDRGTRYQAQAHGGSSTDGTWWSGAFRLSPTLPADARWIDITTPSGAGTVRIGLADSPATGPPPAVPSHRQIPAWGGALPPTGGPPAERLLDLLAEDLLWSVLWTGDGGQAQSELATMIPALRSAGVVEPGSPAFARLITLARQLDIDLPHGSPTVSPADLPQAWTGALGARDRRDGHDGLTPAAAVLPETDGGVFAITGLHSTGQAVILRALAWGWVPARTRFPRTGQRYSWTALDDAGRWHIARQTGGPIGGMDGHGLTDIALIPPLHPAATSLDIILTGPTTQANATVTLHWQPLR